MEALVIPESLAAARAELARLRAVEQSIRDYIAPFGEALRTTWERAERLETYVRAAERLFPAMEAKP